MVIWALRLVVVFLVKQLSCIKWYNRHFELGIDGIEAQICFWLCNFEKWSEAGFSARNGFNKTLCHLQWSRHSSSWQTVRALLLIVRGPLGTLHHNSMWPKYVSPISLDEILPNIQSKSTSHSLFSIFSTEKSASFSCCGMQSLDWILPDAVGEPRRGMCSVTGKKCNVRRPYWVWSSGIQRSRDERSLCCPPETPDSSNKRTLHRLQQAGSHGNHHFHGYDEIGKVAPNRQDAFRWWVSSKVQSFLRRARIIGVWGEVEAWPLSGSPVSCGIEQWRIRRSCPVPWAPSCDRKKYRWISLISWLRFSTPTLPPSWAPRQRHTCRRVSASCCHVSDRFLFVGCWRRVDWR